MKVVFGLALAAVLMVAGCTDPIPAHRDYVARQGQIELNSYWLQTWTKVGDPVVNRVGSGQVEVTVPIRNLTDEELLLDYQYTFKNAAGAPVENTSGWHNIRIPRKGHAAITFTSMTPLPEDFHVQIRHLK